jgi:hypothetical protein
MHRSGLAGVLAGALVLLVAAVAIGLPYLDKERDYRASVPQPPSLIAIQLVRMQPGESACLHDAVMNARSERALFQVETFAKPTVPLRLELTGRGYRATATVPASSYQDEGIVQARVTAPPRDVLVTACVVNAGRREVALYATTPPERSAVNTTVAGHAIVTNPWLAFYEEKPTSIANRLPTILERMAVFRPAVIGPWLLWPLAVLFVFGVPAAILLAYGRGLRDDDDAAS